MKISGKGLLFGCLILLVIISFAGSVNAITGSIGNGRMVLRAETGDKLEKYVKVINNNDVDIDIEISASGDLADYIEIKDKNFSLEPGEEKNAYFTIDVKKSGKTESKINVKFIPKGGGNGVGLSSVVIVIAEGEDLEDKSILDIFEDGEYDIADDVLGEDKISTTGKVIVEGRKINTIAIALSITAVVLLIFIVILILYYLDKKRGEEIKPKKRVRKR